MNKIRISQKLGWWYVHTELGPLGYCSLSKAYKAAAELFLYRKGYKYGIS